MTVGIALLLLWIGRIVAKLVSKIEEEVSEAGCGTFILSVAYIGVTIWMIVHLWDTPW